MHTRNLFLLCAALLAGPVVAQPSAGLQPVLEIAPPPGMVNDPSLEPQITIQQRGQDRVEEYRVRGRLYMIKVTPPGSRPYYLVDPRGDGQFRRIEDMSPQFLVPLWLIHAF